jgi:hypothetical protein
MIWQTPAILLNRQAKTYRISRDQITLHPGLTPSRPPMSLFAHRIEIGSHDLKSLVLREMGCRQFRIQRKITLISRAAHDVQTAWWSIEVIERVPKRPFDEHLVEAIGTSAIGLIVPTKTWEQSDESPLFTRTRKYARRFVRISGLCKNNLGRDSGLGSASANFRNAEGFGAISR